MTKQSIVVNGTSYTHDQILHGIGDSKSLFEKSTLDFCRAWLKGEELFQLETSGSTGTPKNIRVTRAQMIASAKMTEVALALKPNYTTLVCLDTKYIAGKMMLVRSFVTGMNIMAVEPTANPLGNLNTDQIIDFAAFVPYQLHTIIHECPEKLNQVKIAIIGGGKVDDELNQKLRTVQCQLYETFGMTETLSHVALRKVNGKENENYFNTLPGIKIHLDKRGCLVIDIPFIKKQVITNDIVEITKPSQFRWLGRWDNVINTGGAKVIPEEVESVLKKLFDEMNWPYRFFVAGIKDPILGQKVCLVIEGEEMSDPINSELKHKIKEKIHRFEVPKDILFLRKFVETKTGKINRMETLNLFPAKFHDRN